VSEFSEFTLEELGRVPWILDAKRLGIPIQWLGEFSAPMCPEHGWIDMRKFGRYRWGCAAGQPRHRRWSQCHWRFEYNGPEGARQ
jgi:hypothetical protein